MIEDLRHQKELLEDDSDDGGDDLGSFMVRKFVTTTKLISKRETAPRSTRKS